MRSVQIRMLFSAFGTWTPQGISGKGFHRITSPFATKAPMREIGARASVRHIWAQFEYMLRTRRPSAHVTQQRMGSGQTICTSKCFGQLLEKQAQSYMTTAGMYGKTDPKEVGNDDLSLSCPESRPTTKFVLAQFYEKPLDALAMNCPKL